MTSSDSITALSEQSWADSKVWFPHMADETELSTLVHMALGLAGEAGEIANVVKKMNRDGHTPELQASLDAELADVQIYLMHVARCNGSNLADAFWRKREFNVGRFGEAPMLSSDPTLDEATLTRLLSALHGMPDAVPYKSRRVLLVEAALWHLAGDDETAKIFEDAAVETYGDQSP